MAITLKIVLVGNSGLGKSSFLDKHLTGKFSIKYNITIGVSQYSLKFKTSYGIIYFDVYDVGATKYGDHIETIFKDARGIIVFHDRDNILDTPLWINRVHTISPDIPVVIVYPKKDVLGFGKIDTLDRTKYQYYCISSKDGYNIDKPFLYLARSIIDKSITLVKESKPLVNFYIGNVINKRTVIHEIPDYLDRDSINECNDELNKMISEL